MDDAAGATDPRVGSSLTVVHVSDLHFGRFHRFGRETTADGDQVVGGPTLLESIKADLGPILSSETGYPPAPVLIAVTGDLTEVAAPAQFKEASEFILGLEAFLNSPAIIVPGNHDVLWEEADIDNRLGGWRDFARSRMNRDLVGLPETVFAKVYDTLVHSHGAVIAAINSAAFVQRDKLNQNRGRISPEGLWELDRQLRELADDNNSIRIALVHHHPILIPDLVEAGRGYDAIAGGGDLMQILRRHRFHLILHGHKHLPFQFSEDSRAAYSTAEPREQRPIFLVCGGSAGSSQLSEQMQTPTNFYNIIRIKWLPNSQECRTRVEPRSLARFKAGVLLPRGEWRWESCVPDDRCFAPSATGDPGTSPGSETTFAESELDDSPRQAAYADFRGAFPVVDIQPSLIASQAHEARVWIERHRPPAGITAQRIRKAVWSAGPRHGVATIIDDATGRYAATFTYYGAMLIQVTLTFEDGDETSQFIYARLRRHGASEEE
jgi:3',5'-cyclic AMP phosphodiesterase CpdA